MSEKCYVCGGEFAQGWWCTRCKITRGTSEGLRGVDRVMAPRWTDFLPPLFVALLVATLAILYACGR